MKKDANPINSRNPDKVVSQKFSASYMNNSKWDKLIDTLTDRFDQIYLNSKLIYEDEVKGSIFDRADFKPFFMEPTLYKEVEWVEFPSSYTDWVNRNNRKAGKKNCDQDLLAIKTAIDSLGQFELEVEGAKIRIYGYK